MAALAAFATSKVLAFDCLTIPKPIMLTPSPLNSVSSSSAANSTRATSARRTKNPSEPAFIAKFAKSKGVKNERATRTSKSRSLDSTRPAGSSTFSERITRSMSLTVTPRAAIALRSSHTFIAYVRPPPICTRAIPSVVDKRSTIKRSA